MFYWLFSICGLILIYYKFYKPHQYWKDRQINYESPIPIIGNMFPLVFRLKSMTELTQDLYNSQNSRYFGFYQFLTPVLMIKDINLLKQIAIKDFDNFCDHTTFIPEEIEPVFNKSLIALKGQKWKIMRSILTPAFTNSKMRTMFSLISECAKQVIQDLKEKADSESPLIVEMKDIYSRYTNDVIASCAFGVQCNSFKERNNEFFLNGKDISNFTDNFKHFCYIVVPWLMKMLNIKIFSDKLYNFLSTFLISAIKQREEQSIICLGIINWLMEGRKEKVKIEEPNKDDINMDGFALSEDSFIAKKVISDESVLSSEDIVAQALTFFIAAFETTSTLLAAISYELAINPDIQQKLHNEVDIALKKCDKNITYKVLSQMKYLDMVVCEGLRKWPPASLTDRVCVKTYVINPTKPNEKPAIIEKGVRVWIPIFAIHRDPEHFPDPEKFDPERFNDKNKSNIKSSTFIPFGIGPRYCIGSRFGILKTKLMLFYVMALFEFVVVEKTQIPLKINPKKFVLSAEKGYWLGLKLRK